MNEPQLHWQDSQWLDQAHTWILAECAHHNITLTGPIEQPHIYPWSTVLRVPTNEGNLFFKATAPETIYEAALTQTLTSWYPDSMPELVAADTLHGWMLMRDGGEPLRASIRPNKDLTPWTPVIQLFSELQAGMSARVSELLACGVPDWRLANLPVLYAQLLTDAETLRVDLLSGLTSAEFERLQSLAPRFAQICTDLAAFNIPESLNHGDFHDGNVLLKNGSITLFDWGDGCVTHPFVTLRTFFVSMEIALGLDDYAPPTRGMRTLLHVYLKPWERFAPKEKLLAAYELSRPVASIVKALAWHKTVSSTAEPFREKYVHIVPEVLREFMVYERLIRVI